MQLRSLLANASNRLEVAGDWKLVAPGTGTPIENGSSLRRDLRTAGATLARPMRLIPAERWFRVSGRTYRGTLLMEPGPDGVQLILETDLESYLPGVLQAELGASFPPAALRAQAVASRTYALHKSTVAPVGQHFDVADDQTDQVFRGTPAGGRGPLFDATAATRGMVLLHLGRPLPAYFHSTCGGHTSPVEAVFGGPAIPPLSGVPCAYCAGAPHYRWQGSIPLLDASRALGLGDAMVGMRVGRRDPGGRALTLVLLSDRETSRPAAEVRMVLGPAVLRSTLIRAFKVSGADLRWEGGGWGHGVGLCQMGAKRMAESGAAASDILAQYYPGAQLFRLY